VNCFHAQPGPDKDACVYSLPASSNVASLRAKLAAQFQHPVHLLEMQLKGLLDENLEHLDSNSRSDTCLVLDSFLAGFAIAEERLMLSDLKGSSASNSIVVHVLKRDQAVGILACHATLLFLQSMRQIHFHNCKSCFKNIKTKTLFACFSTINKCNVQMQLPAAIQSCLANTCSSNF
jgi:hypothetical protein